MYVKSILVGVAASSMGMVGSDALADSVVIEFLLPWLFLLPFLDFGAETKIMEKIERGRRKKWWVEKRKTKVLNHGQYESHQFDT